MCVVQIILTRALGTVREGREETAGTTFVTCISNATVPVTTEQEGGGFQIHDKYDELSEPRSIKANRSEQTGRREKSMKAP